MSDSSPSDPEDERPDTLRARLGRLWRASWSALFKALLVSIGLHLLLALPVWLQPSLPGDFDIEWEGRMGELAEIGHGTEDFDDRDEPDFDDMADFEADLEEVDEDPDEPDEPEEPDEPDEEPEEDEPDPDPVETAEEAEEDEIGPGPEQADDDPEEGDEDERAVAEADDPSPDDLSGDELPGVEKTGPSQLPEMRDYGPGNARVTSLVRTDRLRGTEFEPYVDDLIRAIPDYRIALEGTDFDPVSDLDSLFMATARPQILQETFLAARHRFEDDELKTLLDTRFEQPVGWENREGRPVRRLVPQSAPYPEPRRLMLAEPGLALIGQPAWFEELIGPVDEDSDLGRELEETDDAPSVFTLMDGLSRIETAAEDDETIMLIGAYGFRLPANLEMIGVDVGDLPVFNSAQVKIADAEHPDLTIDLQLRSDARARQFADRCPELRDELADSLQSGLLSMSKPMRKTGEIIEQLECRHEGRYVVVEGDYRGDQVRELLETLPPFLDGFAPRGVEALPEGPTDRDDEPDEPDDEPDEPAEEDPESDAEDHTEEGDTEGGH